MFHTTFGRRRRLGARLKALAVSIATAGAATAVLAPTPVLATGSEGFLVLQAGFTQTLWGTFPSATLGVVTLGGVAFATNGDVLADHCNFSGSSLTDYSQTSTSSVNGSTLHNHSELTSNAGCGLANHPDGTLYSNTSNGVVNLDANTGAQIGAAFGPAGRALGIATDPVTNNLVYVGSDGTMRFVEPAGASPRHSGTFSTATTGDFIDGIAFEPAGNFLFVSDRTGNTLTIIKRDGSLVQKVSVGREPDGIAFHAVAPKFVVTNNTDGTMTRFDFPGNDYTMTATVSSFASGGFRGDLAQVGADACLYLTQAGTRFADGTVTTDNSIVQICGGFAPPIEKAISATGTTINATEGAKFTGTVATFTDPTITSTAAEYSATIDWGDGSSSAGTVSGPTGGPFTVSGGHTYAEEGTYAIKVTITDIDTTTNTATAISTADVADAALTASPACSATSSLIYNGPTATFTDAASPSGTLSDFSATIDWGDGTVTAGTVTGPNGGPYTVSGSHTYATTGTFTITTKIKDVGGSKATTSCNTLGFAFAPGGGSFVIGDQNAAVGNSVTFWGAQWAKKNPTSGGSAPRSFKGFAEDPTTPSCGVAWTTDPGNSTPPPDGPLPAFMAVIVTSSVGKDGSEISGNTVHIVVVKTNPGYAANPGHAGTGTVVAVVC
jgi:hypothetical protein